MKNKNNLNPVSIIAYHGSSNKFNEFNLSHFNSATKDGGMYGRGFYFTESPELAKLWNDHGYLYKVRLQFQNPLVLYNNEDRDRFLDDYAGEGTNNIFTDKIIKDGYDGIISIDEDWETPDGVDVEYHDQYVVFDDANIQIISVEPYTTSMKEGMQDMTKLVNEENKKKKKPAFGFFGTLNPDAGDVEKVIDIFNNSVADNISEVDASANSEGMSDGGDSAGCAESISNKRNNTLIKEAISDDYIDVVTIYDIREDSINNMTEDEIDFQEDTFANISRKLHAYDADIVAMSYDTEFYNYDPDYLTTVTFKTDTDDYGKLYTNGDLTFYKEARYPFLYFKNRDDLEYYLDICEEEDEYDI